ncbi:hypothetical protein H097_27160 [Pseudomonas sp. FH4]|nr:hypothetical protein H097_27160 [Pseudomonas sp. FH4]
MIATVLATAMIFGLFWVLLRIGRRNTRGWWIRDYFGKVVFYVAIFVAPVVGRQFDFPNRLVLALPAAFVMSLLIALPSNYKFLSSPHKLHLLSSVLIRNSITLSALTR